MTTSFRYIVFSLGIQRPLQVFVQSHHVTRRYVHRRSPYRTLAKMNRHNPLMLCDCSPTVNSDVACPSYLRNQYRRFAPHKHVSLCIVCSEASNVLWVMLTRREHHSCARSWCVSAPKLWLSDAGHEAEPSVPVRRPLSLPWRVLQRKVAVSV